VCVLHKYSWWPEGVGAKGGVVGVGHKNCASGATNTFWQKRKKNKKEKKTNGKARKNTGGKFPAVVCRFAVLPFLPDSPYFMPISDCLLVRQSPTSGPPKGAWPLGKGIFNALVHLLACFTRHKLKFINIFYALTCVNVFGSLLVSRNAS